MNAHNNENDPFEDVFRDRFADFESEPDAHLWQKIEPQLPVNSTRTFSYWQISAVVILLLTAFWTYREIYSIDNLTEKILKSDNNQTVNFENHNNTKSDDSQTASITKKNNTKSDDSQIENIQPYNNTESDDGQTGSIQQNNNTKSDNNQIANITKKNNTKSDGNQTANVSDYRIVKESLNPNIITNDLKVNSSNYHSILNVFSNQEQVSVLSKNDLMLLDLKSYRLLGNYFKTPQIKFTPTPKKDDYFKERKPLEMYVSVMPLLNYYTITPNGNDANYVHSISVNNDDDRLGFYTQAGVIFTLSDKFKLRTGLTFTKTNHSINYQIRTDSLIVQSPNRQGVDVSFSELNKTYSQSANYLGTKVEVQYIFLEGEGLTHYLNVGLEGAYRLNGGNQFNEFANFAYGITRRIGDNTYLFVEPTFSYSLNQQNENNSFLLVKPNKIGFNIGVNFKIK